MKRQQITWPSKFKQYAILVKLISVNLNTNGQIYDRIVGD